MNLDDFIITVFCLIDDLLPHALGTRPVRASGPAPRLGDSEILTMEIVGAYLGIEQDSALFAYMRQSWSAFFPQILQVHRTTFVRQAANLWVVKERLWQALVQEVPHDREVAMIDSFPLPVCRFARASTCRRFRGEASYGKDTVAKQTFYGFRAHVTLAAPGVMTHLCLAPAHIHDLDLVEQLAHPDAVLIGDRNYWSPRVHARLQAQGIELLAPFKSKTRDPHPAWSALLSRYRQRIEVVFSQLVERAQIKRVWARDLWHLGSRLLRMVLMHLVAVLLALQSDLPPLQISTLVHS
jgi:hypothetical protein